MAGWAAGVKGTRFPVTLCYKYVTTLRVLESLVFLLAPDESTPCIFEEFESPMSGLCFRR